MKLKNLNHRCNIQQRQSTVDEIGDPATAWVDVKISYPCTVTEKPSTVADSKTGGLVTVKKKEFKFRAFPGFSETMRIVYAGTAYKILTAKRDGRYITVTCDGKAAEAA